MKKNLFIQGGALAASLLLVTACAQDEMGGGNDLSGNDGTVTFTATLPAFATRAAGDGTTATDLSYAVYAAGETTPLIEDETTFTDLTATVSLRLVTGKSYDILFWASAPDAPYTVDFATQSVAMNYDAAPANAETRDAFFAARTALEVTGPVNERITLTRPFAQVNIGTDDRAEAEAGGIDFAALQTSLTVSEVCTTLNLKTGEVSNPEPVSFTLAALPAGQFTAGGAQYDYLSMNYLLMAVDKGVVDCEMGIHDAAGEVSTLTVSSVPVQRNYRTNVFGSLLTAPADFEVEIDPDFGQPDIEHPIWDGTSTDEVTPDADTYTISTPAELAWFAAEVNGGTTFEGQTVVLSADIDLGGHIWTPVGPNADAGNKFRGTFDGQNHAIRNLYIDQTADPQYRAAGLFGALNGTVRNLTVEHAVVRSISAPGSSGATSNGTAIIAGSLYPAGLIENVTINDAELAGNRYLGGIAGYAYGSIKECKVDGIVITATQDDLTGNLDNGDKAGGIAGYVGNGSHEITGNTVTNATVTAYRDLGGIAGTVNDGVTVTGNTVTDSKIQYTGGLGILTIDEIVGRKLGTVTVENNTFDNVTTGAAE